MHIDYIRASRRCPRSGLPPAPLHSFARARPRLAKPLGPCLHALHDRDLAHLSPSIAPHPQMKFVKAATVPAVWPRVRGPCSKDRPSAASKSMWDRRLSVAGHEAGDHRHAAEHILDGADVEAGEGCAAGEIVKYGHPFLLHDAVGSEVDRLECAEEGQGHFCMASYVMLGASRAQGTPKQ